MTSRPWPARLEGHTTPEPQRRPERPIRPTPNLVSLAAATWVLACVPATAAAAPGVRPCATGSPAMLEANRLMQETPEAFFPGGSPMARPGRLRGRVVQRGNIAHVVDQDYQLIPRRMNWGEPENVGQLNANLIRAFYAVFDDDYDFLVFFTERNLTGIAAYYSPIQNDVTGIGYQHSGRDEVFGPLEGDWRLQGIIIMNNFFEYLGPFGEQIGRMTFNQELGHRWGTRVHIRLDGQDSDELLGRDLSHWSYFLHTDNSSMEGNTWVDVGRSRFESATRTDRFAYNSLDLYLMGFLAPEEADRDELFLVRDPRTGRQTDLMGNPLRRASPPQIGRSTVTISGERHDVLVRDIIRAEGERSPSSEESPREFRIAFVLILRETHDLDDDDFDAFDAMRRRMATDWMRDVDGAATLHTYLGDRKRLGEPCRFASECNPDDDAICHEPALETDRVCLPRCDGDNCPVGWCCEGDDSEGGLLCVPPDHCTPPETVEEDAGTPRTDAGVPGEDAAVVAPDAGGSSSGVDPEPSAGEGSGGGVRGRESSGALCATATAGSAHWLRAWLVRR